MITANQAARLNAAQILYDMRNKITAIKSTCCLTDVQSKERIDLIIDQVDALFNIVIPK